MSANDHQWVNSPYKKWYKRWVIYHVATYSLAGAILFPLSHVRETVQIHRYPSVQRQLHVPLEVWWLVPP